MKVVIFEPHYDEKHRRVLRALAEGIPGSTVKDVREYEPCDVAVIFGSVKHAYPPTYPKREILKRHSGRSLLMVESAFVKRGEYWQVGWGGFAGYADFNTRNITDMTRWESFGVKTKPWSNKLDGPIIVCGQLPRDTQVQDTDHIGWCQRTVRFYKYHRILVRFRPHPRVGDVDSYGVEEDFIDTRSLKETLADARCFVTWNSTSGVDAAIAGVPVIACEQGSMVYSIASHSLDIAKLRFPSRRKWLAELAYSQWTLEEMKSGITWNHLTRLL